MPLCGGDRFALLANAVLWTGSYITAGKTFLSWLLRRLSLLLGLTPPLLLPVLPSPPPPPPPSKVTSSSGNDLACSFTVSRLTKIVPLFLPVWSPVPFFSVSVSVSVCLSVCPSICLSLSLSVCLSVCLSLSLSIWTAGMLILPV